MSGEMEGWSGISFGWALASMLVGMLILAVIGVRLFLELREERRSGQRKEDHDAVTVPVKEDRDEPNRKGEEGGESE